MTFKIDMTKTYPEPDDVTPATDEAIAAEFNGYDFEPHYDDIPLWLEADAEYKNRREARNVKRLRPCVFCQWEGVNPPAEGEMATGSYRPIDAFEVGRPLPFRGHVCDMHRNDIEWVSLSEANPIAAKTVGIDLRKFRRFTIVSLYRSSYHPH